jgi:hypothetical protein
VNPVEIWEGIESHEESGHNHLTKLAIHILSIVANSASCGHAFSHMGLIHTGIHSKLGVEKVHETTMVGMDIKHMHLEASLLYTRGQQNFTSEAGPQEPSHNNSKLVADHLDIDQDDDLLNFDQLSECLIVGTASTNVDKDVGDDLDETDELPPTITVWVPSGPLVITISPLNLATLSPQATQMKRTCVPVFL